VNYSFNAIQSEKLGVSYPIHPIFFLFDQFIVNNN